MRSGIFTATESSCIAIVYAFLVTLLVYRSMTWGDFVVAAMAAVRTTAMVLLVVGCAAAFGWLLAYLQRARGAGASSCSRSRTIRSPSC